MYEDGGNTISVSLLIFHKDKNATQVPHIRLRYPWQASQQSDMYAEKSSSLVYGLKGIN